MGLQHPSLAARSADGDGKQETDAALFLLPSSFGEWGAVQVITSAVVGVNLVASPQYGDNLPPQPPPIYPPPSPPPARQTNMLRRRPRFDFSTDRALHENQYFKAGLTP